MKTIKLNGNDIEKLINKIIKEDNEWFDDAIKGYDLVGIYTRRPVQKMSGMSGGEVLEITEVDGLEATVFISYNLNAVISGYPYSAEGPYYMDVKDLIDDIEEGNLTRYTNIKESRMFDEPKKSVDERITEHLLNKLTERPDVQHEFIPHSMGVGNFYEITSNQGVLEADIYRVDFKNKSTRISKNSSGFLTGGDFGVLKVYNPSYKKDVGNRTDVIGYAVKLTGDDKPLNIPKSLAKKVYETVEDQFGDIKVYKTQRKIDVGIENDESDLFDQVQ